MDYKREIHPTQEFSGTVKMEGMVSREMPMSVKGTIRLGPLEEE